MNEIPVSQICLQGCCSASGQNAPHYTHQSFPALPYSLAGPPNIHHMTAVHAALGPAQPTGKPKYVVSKQPAHHRLNFPHPPPHLQPVHPSPVYLSNFPTNAVNPSTSHESFFYGTQPYYHGINLYRPQIQTPQFPTPVPPRPCLAITQYNYQPVRYSQVQSQASTSNLVFRVPSRDRRCRVDNQRRPEKIQERPRTPNNHEYTTPPEQIVRSICEDNDQMARISDESTSSNIFGTPRAWDFDFPVDLQNLSDFDLTKFIVNGCVKAENIAVRNQHRPCFKNIKHLCTRTRTDILKPRTTIANIHSQGIPWATKDFIFAFVRLINCWYILKGYLDDRETSLGKIDQALSPEFRSCYQKWISLNKEMIKHLMNIFIGLDHGITVQNAEIFCAYNKLKNSISCCSLDGSHSDYKPFPGFEHKTIPSSLDPHHISVFDSHLIDKLKDSMLAGKNVPGILRIKNVCNDSPSTSNKEDEIDYNDPGSYMRPGNCQPLEMSHGLSLDLTSRDRSSSELSHQEAELSDDDWSENEDSDRGHMKQTQDWLDDHYPKFTFSLEELIDRDLSSSSQAKPPDEDFDFIKEDEDNEEKDDEDSNEVSATHFESTIDEVEHENFARYVTVEINTANVPEFDKFIKDPILLYQVLSKLKHNEYTNAEEVVNDLRSIIRNSEKYLEFRFRKPDFDPVQHNRDEEI